MSHRCINKCDVFQVAPEGPARRSAIIEGDWLIHHHDRLPGVHTSFVGVAGPSPTHVRCDGVAPDQE